MKKTNGSLNFEIIIFYFWYLYPGTLYYLLVSVTVTVTGGVRVLVDSPPFLHSSAPLIYHCCTCNCTVQVLSA